MHEEQVRPGDYADGARLAELVEYTRGDLARRDAADGREIHIHYHSAAPIGITPPPPVSAAPDVLARYVPYMILYLGFMVLGMIMAVVLVMITPTLLAIMGGIVSMLIATATAIGSLAIFAVGFASMTRSLRSSKIDKQILDRRLKATRK